MAAEPRYCYLTHFGRIAAGADHAESLRCQVGDYVRLAGDIDVEDAGAQAALAAALTDYTVARLRAAGNTLPVTTLHALLARCPQATLVAHPRGARHLVEPSRLIAGAKAVYGEEAFTRMYGEIVPAPAARVSEAADGSRWSLGRRELLVRDTPGHARHHFCVWDETSRGWFTGDTYGIAYRELHCGGRPFLIPTTTPVQFEPEAMLDSIAR